MNDARKTEDGPAMALRSGELVRGSLPRRNSPLLIVAAICGGMPSLLMDRSPNEPKRMTPADLERIAAADAKRDRKRARKNAAMAAAPNQ